MTTIPWGDVATAFHTTGIANISTFTSVPSAMRFAKFAFPLLATAPAQKFLKKWIEKNVHGPDEAHRARARMYLVGKSFESRRVQGNQSRSGRRLQFHRSLVGSHRKRNPGGPSRPRRVDSGRSVRRRFRALSPGLRPQRSLNILVL